MEIRFDPHQILIEENPQLPQLKPYHYSINGLELQSYDTGLFVYYKRQWKLIQLKNFSEGMQVAYQVKRVKSLTFERNSAYLQNTLTLFKGFDEERGQPYFFFPFCKKSLEDFQNLLDQQGIFWTLDQVQGTTRLLGLQVDFQRPATREEKIWFMFSLALLYGKFDLKNGAISAFKVHFPLVWNAVLLQENFSLLVKELQAEGLFITINLQEQGGKRILQLSSSDFELMELFEKGYRALKLGELSDEVSPARLKNHEIKAQLLTFLQQEKAESLTSNFLLELENSTLKFLKY